MQARILLALIVATLTAPAFGQGVVTTIAGTDWLFPGDGRPAINAPLSGTVGIDVALDRDGNLYFVDFGNGMAMRVGPDGIINVIAGNGVNFNAGDGGLAINAALIYPISIAVDDFGNTYIGEIGGRIRKVSNDGVITTFAGTGNSGFSGDNGPATSAKLDSAFGIAIGRDSSIYFSDTENHRIRKIAPNGIITTIAGTGVAGLSGDGAAATQARLNRPTRIAIDDDNNVYFIDSSNRRLRKIDNRGNLSTLAGGFGQDLPLARPKRQRLPGRLPVRGHLPHRRAGQHRPDRRRQRPARFFRRWRTRPRCRFLRASLPRTGDRSGRQYLHRRRSEQPDSKNRH
jgi:hypothetical protein